MNELVLKGIDGANPLGFLAATGAFTVANDIWPNEVTLTWRKDRTYRPVLKYPDDSLQGSTLSVEECEILLAKRIATQLKVPAQEVSAKDEKKVDGLYKAFQKLNKENSEKEKETKKELRELNKTGPLKGLTGETLAQWIDDKKSELTSRLAQNRKKVQSAREAWLDRLSKTVPSEELGLGKTLSISQYEFRSAALEFAAAADSINRRTADLIAAFASESFVDDNGKVVATPFCFVTGSGHQYFLETVGKLMSKIDHQRISKSLFSPWHFEDERLSLRWAPLEDRRYALAWEDPSGNAAKTDWAANFLAYQSLRLFPAAQYRGRFQATGFSEHDHGLFFSWPIWDAFISVDCLRSLLAHKALASDDGDEKEFNSIKNRGVIEIFRCERLRVGTPPLDKINFSISKPL